MSNFNMPTLGSLKQINFENIGFLIVGVKTKWKAAIDFKWIRDNKDSVAANIKNRNSTANLDLVLELYENMLTLQKVKILVFCSGCLFAGLSSYFVLVSVENSRDKKT